MNSTLQSLLVRAAGFPDAGLRFVEGGERERFFAWSEIDRRAAAVAGTLAARGVGGGDRVALVFPTGVGFFDAFFGALYAGAVPVPLYPPVRLGRLDEYLERTAAMIAAVDARLVVGDRRLLALIGAAVAAARPALGALAAAEPGVGGRIEPLRRLGASEDLALVQFSSGTTVEPKPVALEQRAVLSQVRALNGHWPDSAEVRHAGVSWLPLYHDMGLIGTVLPALERPAVLTLIAPERFVARPALWLRALSRHRATISVAPNFAYALATERIRDEEIEGCDLSAWTTALCGAETVSATTLRAFAGRFARWGFRAEALTPVYGLSEAALAVTFAPLDRRFRSVAVARRPLVEERRIELVESNREISRSTEAGAAAKVPEACAAELTRPAVAPIVECVSVGRALPGFALELRDHRGSPVAERRVGRLFVAGPSLFREYLGQPKATRAALRDGWLDTGDLGFFDDGELFLVGRAKDVVVVRGQNHAPEELERAVDRVEGVRTGCAVAVSYRIDGEETDRVLLFVEHRRGRAAAGATIEAGAHAATTAARAVALDQVVVLAPGALPRTSSGKLRRGETLERHLDGRLVAPARLGPLALGRALWRGRRALARATTADDPGGDQAAEGTGSAGDRLARGGGME